MTKQARAQVGAIFLATALVAASAFAARQVGGRITVRGGEAARGYQVEVWDEDAGSDDKMAGPVLTDSNGGYRLEYRKGKWDTDVPGTAVWRPDIYIRVKKQGGYCEDGRWVKSSGWHEIKRSGVSEDHRVANNLTRDLVIDMPSIVSGTVRQGSSMHCEPIFFFYHTCFACLDGYKLEWSEIRFVDPSQSASVCGDVRELRKCSPRDWETISRVDPNSSGYIP